MTLRKRVTSDQLSNSSSVNAPEAGEREGMNSKDGDLVNRVIAAISIAITHRG